MRVNWFKQLHTQLEDVQIRTGSSIFILRVYSFKQSCSLLEGLWIERNILCSKVYSFRIQAEHFACSLADHLLIQLQADAFSLNGLLFHTEPSTAVQLQLECVFLLLSFLLIPPIKFKPEQSSAFPVI